MSKKRYLIITIIAIFLMACSKEDELEGVTISNPYDVPTTEYVSVVGVERINCDLIIMDLRLNQENIPDTLNFESYLIKGEDNVAIKSSKVDTVYVPVICDEINLLRITLFDETRGLESKPTFYTYTP